MHRYDAGCVYNNRSERITYGLCFVGPGQGDRGAQLMNMQWHH